VVSGALPTRGHPDSSEPSEVSKDRDGRRWDWRYGPACRACILSGLLYTSK